jgi:hypothetical protein
MRAMRLSFREDRPGPHCQGMDPLLPVRTAQTVAALGSLSLMASGMPDALQALTKGGVAVEPTRAVSAAHPIVARRPVTRPYTPAGHPLVYDA